MTIEARRFIIEVLATKFQQHSLDYRHSASRLEDQGIPLSRQTLKSETRSGEREEPELSVSIPRYFNVLR